MNNFSFKIIARDKKTKARVGKIITPHGSIDTPSFVAVGTRATVRGLTPLDLEEIGTQILFGNTYHLHLRPGEDVIKDFGGLGKFMSWDGPTITDSGGFQVFSLGKVKTEKVFQQGAEVAHKNFLVRDAKQGLSSNRFKNPASSHNENFVGSPRQEELEGLDNLVKITDDRVTFRSHLDGSLHEFTPEKSIEIQQKLGADIILAFDECAPYPSTYEYAKQAMERTHRWAIRSLKQHYSTSEESFHNTSEVTVATPRRWPNGLLRGGHKQALYGIIQGGVYKDLREESAKFISNLALSGAEGFDGIAIGGVSVGESKKQMRDALNWVLPFLPEEKPRHLLGIGEIDDIFDSIEKGIDTFDCVIPTRLGRYGLVFVASPEGNMKNKFMIDIKKSIFGRDKNPLTKDCLCYVCKSFTRAYIHHLFRVQELLAYRLASYHNLYFINNLVAKIREAIFEGDLRS